MKKKVLAIITAALIGTTAFAATASAASGSIDVISLYPVKTDQEQEEHSLNCLDSKRNREMKK